MKTPYDSQPFGGHVWRTKHISHGDKVLDTYFIEDKATRRTTWHCHIIMQFMLSVSCNVRSRVIFATSFMDYVNSILEKCNVKWKSKSYPCNTKSHLGSWKVIEKSNSHEGSPRVTREVNCHPICYIHPHRSCKGHFSLAPPTRN